ncbi:DNA methyltransferase [Polyangium mundeleinium]|uniref:DNA methyltransferase n=1 Tax=Polyangium mundeleinium TaxID=2995306 RepID=A0ABT5EH85_9BACT|nr:DNA methyltransferase [Polyangium mundeleinium]MDC0740859.1 DNA methyltransferase [Polyangium mundeleinium]
MKVAKKAQPVNGDLFIEESGQLRIANKSVEQRALERPPVECLGLTFESEEARRAYFLDKLREKLGDPSFRNTPGFPKADDDAILRLSDPPYFTACPNPFIGELLQRTGSCVGASGPALIHKPFAFDVTEGKQDPVCMAHTYHTKVPYRAIVRYILHYTKPGDVVLDSFSGTGMTGLAAQICGAPDPDFRNTIEEEWRTAGFGAPTWGRRFAVLSDISPFATFLAHNFNATLDVTTFEQEAQRIVAETEKKYGWVYETDGGRTAARGSLQYVIWSESIFCECGREILFWDPPNPAGTLPEPETVFKCPACGANVVKRSAQRATTTFVDSVLNTPVTQNKQTPVFVEARVDGATLRKRPSAFDMQLFKKVEAEPISNYVPMQPMMFKGAEWGDMFRAGYHFGITHAHHFWTRRNLLVLSELFERAAKSMHPREMLFLCTSLAVKTGSRMHNVGFKGGKINLAGQIYNTLQLTSVSAERNLLVLARGKLEDIKSVFSIQKTPDSTFISTNSATALLGLADGSVDYVFIDPPFGDNIIYSELSFLYESWLRVFTDTNQEAIISSEQSKGLPDYQALMVRAFKELFRVLKPARWLTVAFHNSKNSVWNAIQEALGQAGFVVADVRTLDKGQGTYKQMTTAGAVKQDLVISAYKPSDGFVREFVLRSGTSDSAWQFVREHMRYLPVFVGSGANAAMIAERQPFLLFDRMVAFHIRLGVAVPMGASEFYAGLSQRFVERDGMYFLSDQIAEYDRKRSAVTELRQLDLFVSDEASAVQWLRQHLQRKPQTFQELQPQFMRELQSWAKHERTIELREMLEQNFLVYDGREPVPTQVHSYLSSNYKELRNRDKDDPELREKGKDRWYVPDPTKQSDLHKLRERALLREFEEYKASTPKKLRQFRTEALRTGFKAAYDARDYRTIVSIAKRIPEAVLQEDEKLLMYYDVASMRLGEE